MMRRKDHQARKNSRGVSLVEILIVVAVASILTAIAIPQMINQRRLIRSVGLTREIMTQLRYTRQLALSQSGATATGPLRRVAYTFQYNNVNKQIRIIGPIPAGTAALIDPAYPSNTGSRVVTAIPLTQGGLSSSEISYGTPSASELPSGHPTIPTSLADGVSRTALTSEIINITFQPDGSVINTTNNPLDQAMFIYNNRAASGTASAVSILGASGRVKVWRYQRNGNAYYE